MSAPNFIAVTLALALACLAGPGCKRGKPADCDAAIGHYIATVRAIIEREAKSDEDRQKALSGLPGLREELLTACRKDAWSEGVRACILRAESASALETCDPAADRGAPVDGADEGADAPATP